MSDQDLKQIISQVTGQQQSKKEKILDYTQLLVFSLDNELYGVNITDVKEIISMPPITPIPNSPEFISGLFNLRGKIVVAVDLEKRFSLVRENKLTERHIIIAELLGNNFGIMVDEVKSVLRVPKENIQATPELVTAKIHADYLAGVYVSEDKEEEAVKNKDSKQETKNNLIILLNLPKLLQEKELLGIGETIKKQIS